MTARSYKRAADLAPGDVTATGHVVTDVQPEAGDEVSIDFADGAVEVYNRDTLIEMSI